MKALLLALAALAACVSSDAVTCSDGKLCPAGSKCVALTNPNPQATNPNPELCATQQQLAVCEGIADGVACTDDSGTCYGGLCISPKGCGNGWLDPSEVCDDGNQTSGDGCSADCKSLETCGNGIVDAVKHEECDDGNNIDHDACDSTCHFEAASWTEIAIDQITALDAPSLAFDENHGVAVLFGGDDSTFTTMDLTWLWNGNGWAKTTPASAPRARNRAAMAYDSHRGRIVLFGGGDTLDYGDTWEWDGTSWAPIETPVAPAPRAGAAMAYDAHRQRIVLYGGVPAFGQGDQIGLNGTAFGDTWEWDGTAWKQTIASSAVVGGRGFPAMAYDPVRGKIVMFSGNDGGAGLASSYVYEYDGTTWKEIVVSGPSARWGATMAWDPSSQAIVMFGGTVDGSTPLGDTWWWNGSSWASYTGATAPAARYLAAMTTDPLHGGALLFGGYGDDPPTTWLFSNHAWTELTPAIPGGLRIEPVAFDHDRGRAVIYDGDDSLTWECDGAAWFSTPNVPLPQRAAAGVAYDAAHRKTVLFGGNAGGEMNDTWQWNGTAWTQAFPATSPSPRVVPLVYDAARQQVIAFGGSFGSVAYDETWAWDGTTWKQLTPATKPPARYAESLGFDPVRAQVVLFGGVDAANNSLADTWTWDGTTWTQQHPTYSPNPQGDAALVWNASRAKLEMFDGVTNDVWEWDGMQWSVLAPAQRPPLRIAPLVFPTKDQSGLVMMNGFAPEPPPGFPRAFSDVWRFRFQGASPDEACQLSADVDGDGKTGCADADCWFACAPECPPQASCPASAPKCGDGTCNMALESCRNCPSDCGACTAVCGDAFCDAPETAATCPGDCP